MASWLTIAVVTGGLLLFWKICVKLVVAWDRSYTCLVGKTAIVTGSNTGIGFYTAMDFAKRGARVILACRNKSKAEEAKKKIIRATDNQNIVVKVVDLASLISVREFAEDVNATEERLDILVNNAGALGSENVTTKDGLNLYMQTNYFGPFLLTNLLIGLLKKSAPSRIVNVSSIMSWWAKESKIDNLNVYEKGVAVYSRSKLCTVLFTNELARKLRGSGVDVNSLHPGLIYTDIILNLPFLLRNWVIFLSVMICRSVEAGAQTSVYLAVSKDLQGVSGKYFDNGRIAWLSPTAKMAEDEGLAKKLWERSEEFVKLTAEERQL